MASINMASILAKAKSHMGSSSGKQKVNSVVTNVMLGNLRLQSGGGGNHTPEEAAAKFIEVLQNEINSSGLSPGAAAAISNLGHTSASCVGENLYTVGVYFAGDLSRPSLDEAQYGSISNLAALFNNGVDHTMRPVHGIWHGNEVWSRTTIPGVHFIDSAVHSFMGNYASEYNVIDISVDGIYS